MGVLVRRKKSDGEWYIICRSLNRRCSKHCPDKKTALKLSTQYRKQIALGVFEWPERGLRFKDITFAKLAEEFLEASKQRLKRTTWTSYQALIKLHLRPWKNLYLKEITKQHVLKLLLAKQEQNFNTKNLKICISAVLQFAVERDLLQVNVAHNLGKAIRTDFVPKKVPVVLTKQQRDKFLETAKKAKSPYYVFYLTLFKAGLRLGEALALAVEDIDWQTNQLHICHNFTHGEFCSPKSNKSRMVDLSPHLAETLRQYCLTPRKPCRACPEETHLVFCDRRGDPFDPNDVRIQFHALLAKAGLKRCRLQDARHCYSSVLLSEGASIFYLMKMLGHADTKLICSTYGHLIENKGTAGLVD